MHFMPLIISGTWVVSIMKMTIPIIQQMDIIGSLRQNSNNRSLHRSADEKSGVKIIHRKSSVVWVAKV